MRPKPASLPASTPNEVPPCPTIGHAWRKRGKPDADVGTDAAFSVWSMTQLVAITGGTGFYGKQIAQALLRRGCRLRVLERHQGDVQATPQMTPVHGTLADRKALDRLLDGVDAVVHCAGSFS